ncbi:hypothetical protein ACQEV4_18130 [Streptomyces shenzhenensis]|uniref:hypothetical protein n=1 Tax=Streptomyces shenzhenensis TaxID=943815 RepID=UPI003D8F0330
MRTALEGEQVVGVIAVEGVEAGAVGDAGGEVEFVVVEGDGAAVVSVCVDAGGGVGVGVLVGVFVGAVEVCGVVGVGAVGAEDDVVVVVLEAEAAVGLGVMWVLGGGGVGLLWASVKWRVWPSRLGTTCTLPPAPSVRCVPVRVGWPLWAS